jgi:hypothetical protein
MERHHLRDLGVDVNIILKWILGRTCTGFIWLDIRADGVDL